MTLQGLGNQRPAFVPDGRAGAGEGLVQGDALALLVGDAGQQANLARQRPEDHRGFHAFATQAFEHTQGMGGVTTEGAVDQAEDVEAGAVGHCCLHGLGVDLIAFGEQLELFHFLGGGQQVAFYPRGDHLHRIGAGAQAGLSEALANPLGQLVGVYRPDLDELAHLAVDQGLGPFGFLRTAVELGQAQQEDGVLGRAGQVLEQGGCALVAWLAGRQAQFQQAFLGEQRQAGASLQQVAPVEVGFGIEHLAFAEPLLAAGIANGVSGFLAQQWLVAADRIDRCQCALQVFAELRGGKLHRGDVIRGRASGRGCGPWAFSGTAVRSATAAARPGSHEPGAALPVHRLRLWHGLRRSAAVGPVARA